MTLTFKFNDTQLESFKQILKINALTIAGSVPLLQAEAEKIIDPKELENITKYISQQMAEYELSMSVLMSVEEQEQKKDESRIII